MPIRRLTLVYVLTIAALACSSNRDLSYPDAAGGKMAPGSGGVGGGGSSGSGGGGNGGAGGLGASGGAGGQLVVDAGMDMSPSDGAFDAPNDATLDASPDATGDGAPGDAGPPLMAPAAFEAHGTVTLTRIVGASGSNGGPITQDLLLYVEPVAGSLTVATSGGVTKVPLTSTDRVHFSITGTLEFQASFSPCGAFMRYSSFDFTVQGGQMSGTASGTAIIAQGDIGYSYNAELTFTGSPDTHGPSVTLPAQDADPLRPPAFALNEPLPPTATAQLIGDDDTVALEARPGMSQPVTSFLVPFGRALRYGALYRLAITPWQDLAGNAGAAVGAFLTAAAPPLVAEDGFEGAATMVGGAQIVDGSSLPPITGTRSAVLVASSTTTTLPRSSHLGVRLPVQSGDTVVRFNLRPWGNSQNTLWTGNLATRVAVPGGAATGMAIPSTVALATMVTVGSTTIWLADVIHVEVPLPSGASSEVVVDLNISTVQNACGLPPPPNASYLVDDLRVE